MLRDAVRDSWAYQEILQESRDEGRNEVLQQRLQGQRQILMALVQTRFASLAPLAKKHADEVQDAEVLQSVVLQVLALQDEEQIKQVILSMAPKKTSPKRKKKS